MYTNGIQTWWSMMIHDDPWWSISSIIGLDGGTVPCQSLVHRITWNHHWAEKIHNESRHSSDHPEGLIYFEENMIFHTPLASGKEKCSENPKCQFMFKDHFAEVMISVRQSSSLARLGFFSWLSQVVWSDERATNFITWNVMSHHTYPLVI